MCSCRCWAFTVWKSTQIVCLLHQHWQYVYSLPKVDKEWVMLMMYGSCFKRLHASYGRLSNFSNFFCLFSVARLIIIITAFHKGDYIKSCQREFFEFFGIERLMIWLGWKPGIPPKRHLDPFLWNKIGLKTLFP